MSVVKYHSHTREFVVEESPVTNLEPDVSVEALRLRVRQQQLLADFGVFALKGTPFRELLDKATRLAAEGLKADFAKVLQYRPEDNRFLVCAGVGWGPGVVGTATIGADTASPAGYALKTGKPVISNHLDIEERFRTPQLLVQYGIRRAMNVILDGDAPFGVLEVDSRSEGEFSEDDIVFLRGVANLLGLAIQRQRSEEHVRNALDQQRILMREINHRVNNSLQIVASMLQLHSSATEIETVRLELLEAHGRIAAIARAHHRLYRGDQIDAIDLATYLREVCGDIAASLPTCEISVSAEDSITVPTDRAVPAVLLVNELITNASKHAYPGGGCKIWITLSRHSSDSVVISVRDEGLGLPPHFDQKSGRLGMRLVNSFAQQLKGNLHVWRKEPGTEFVLTFPLNI
jgi:two-component sensor histidine kinase